MKESKIITNQYVQIDQTPAGIGERIFARIIDYIIIGTYIYGLMFAINSSLTRAILLGKYGVLSLVILGLPVLFYSLLWETFNSGRSPGKMLLGMRVVMRDGSTPTIGASLMRWVILLIDMWTFLGIIFIALNTNNCRIGDLAAGTVVIKERDYRRIQVSLDEFQHLGHGYSPVFPQAENLSLEQINAIDEVLSRCDAGQPARIAALAVKVREFLKISHDISDGELLATLTRDYQYYAMEEV